jgi:dTDP-D-glucose 4,6-dehydratase
MILVTGGAGFIGGNFVFDWLVNPDAKGVVNLDKLTYAGNSTLQTLSTPKLLGDSWLFFLSLLMKKTFLLL